MINEWLDILSRLIFDNFWIAPVIVLLAGVLTSLTPALLS